VTAMICPYRIGASSLKAVGVDHRPSARRRSVPDERRLGGC